jgi:serine/threonine-protein kinase RsbW
MHAVHALIGEAVKEYGLSEELAHWLELTISESMINAIQHGNHCDPAKKATLQISSTGDVLKSSSKIRKWFCARHYRRPTDAANLLKPCGRGILIIRSFMMKLIDEVRRRRLTSTHG